jgi:flagellar biosynthesis protein FlhF
MGQKLYKVRGGSLEEAYQAMRRKFGGEAVAVSTRQVVDGGFLGYFGRRSVEITVAAPDEPRGTESRLRSAAERKYAAHSTLGKEPAMKTNLREYEQIIRDAQRRINAGPPEPSPDAAASGGVSPVVPFPRRRADAEDVGQDLRREMQDIREMVQVMYAESPGAGLPAEFAPHYRTLTTRGVSRKVAAALIGAVIRGSDLGVLRDPRVFTERLHFEVRRLVATTGGIALQGGTCRLVTLCGATGVGKTTNLAKLAAHFSVHERARVALITTDTYRVAAPEQLRVYANIIGLPLRVANDAKEIAAALREFREFDLVLMDTAGGSQFNLEQINELKGLLHAAHPHETFLVMSAPTQLDDLRNVVSNFKCLDPTALMFTKLDETRQYGALFSILMESGLPVCYVSTGQNVPDDIRVATPGLIANLVLEGKEHRG